MHTLPRSSLAMLCLALALSWCVGILGRGYWTPDEPREADLAWRMSWQADKSVPLLAGEAFCEKPPLAYWVAGAAIGRWGDAAWVARLPNLLYALVTVLAIFRLGQICAGGMAGLATAAAISTLLLPYQVGIWLATDAPLLAAVTVALLGLYQGFYALDRAQRLRGYTCMHFALGVGFLSKSAAAWMVPVLTMITLAAWERRWRELWRWELYIGIIVQAMLILGWVWAVYLGPQGTAHLKIFFWNNLAGRFAPVAAPPELQYAAAHRNTPGKYLLELPVYLWPWTLLVAAAVRRAWLQRRGAAPPRRAVRFATAVFVPTLIVLSLAATARNIYLAPAFPGVALLLGWWVADTRGEKDRWDVIALRGTALALMLAAVALAAANSLVGLPAGPAGGLIAGIVIAAGIVVSASMSMTAWRAARTSPPHVAARALLFAYLALLIAPASQLYRQVDQWQDLAVIGRALRRDAAGHTLLLFGPDETTRGFVDMYAQTSVHLVAAPLSPRSARELDALLTAHPDDLVLTQLAGRAGGPATGRLEQIRQWIRRASPFRPALPLPPGDGVISDDRPAPTTEWAPEVPLHVVQRYSLPNGRRYALLAPGNAMASR